MSATNTYVLDAWPIAEWLLGKQPAAHKFTLFPNVSERSATRLLITPIRAEILYTFAKRTSSLDQAKALGLLDRLALEVISIDDDLLDSATELKKQFACSYAHCFAAALAMRLEAPVITGDPEFLRLRDTGLLTLEWIGE